MWSLAIHNSGHNSGSSCLLHLHVEDADGTLAAPLPAPAGTTLFELAVAEGPIGLALGGDGSGATMTVRRQTLLHRLPLLDRDRMLAAMALPIGGAVLSPLAHRPLSGGREAQRRWRRSLRVMHDLNLLEVSPVGRPVVDAPQPAGRVRVGAHLHLFYSDLWPDCAAALAQLPQGSALHITGPAMPPDVTEAIRRAFPAATLHVVENVGHDVWPFVKLLGEGAFDGLDAVLKLHAKKSVDPKLLPCVGDLWRRAAFGDLAGSPAATAAAMERFAVAPDLGMLGPARLRVPNSRYDAAAAWGANRMQTLAVGETLGLSPDSVHLDYFAGTMFWVRPAMLARLRARGLRAEDFAPGGLARDGTLSHVLERLMPALVKAAGGRVEGASPLV